MKWHLILQLSRTNTKALAYTCASPCEKLHYIAHYDTGAALLCIHSKIKTFLLVYSNGLL